MHLPTRSELVSLKGQTATDLGMSGYYWSSEQFNKGIAYHVYLPDGGVNFSYGKNYSGDKARCVR
jgi:hypothetical protein